MFCHIYIKTAESCAAKWMIPSVCAPFYWFSIMVCFLEQAQSLFWPRRFKFKHGTHALVLPTAAHVPNTTCFPHLGTSRFLTAPVFFKTTILASVERWHFCFSALATPTTPNHIIVLQSQMSSARRAADKNQAREVVLFCSCSPGSRNIFLCSCREPNSPNFAFWIF